MATCRPSWSPSRDATTRHLRVPVRCLAPLDLTVADIEQIQVHGRLLLCVELAGSNGVCPPVESVGELVERGFSAAHPDVAVTVTELDAPDARRSGARQLVTVLAPAFDPPRSRASSARSLRAARMSTASSASRITRSPATSSPCRAGTRRCCAASSGSLPADLGVDVAVQRAGLHRRAKHLIVLDGRLDAPPGRGHRHGWPPRWAARTRSRPSRRRRWPVSSISPPPCASGSRCSRASTRGAHRLGRQLLLAPGARTLVRTLKRLGYVTAVVSGGFVQVITELMADLGIDHVAANQLEVRAGKVTGRLAGPVVDRARQGRCPPADRRTERCAPHPDRCGRRRRNDIDMLATAGLGIAYNARPIVRDAADTALSVPYLDAILFLLGISREEIEAADSEYPV